jgi:hypothetical protein
VVKAETRFPQTAPTDVAGKSVTAVSRAWGWKTCKTKKLIGKEHRFGAGLGGSDAFVSTSCQRKLESLSLRYKELSKDRWLSKTKKFSKIFL